LQSSQTENAQSNLRITNLERSVRRQEQKTNEFNNILKKQQNKNMAKNLIGSQIQGSLASPPKTTRINAQYSAYKQQLVDLTEDSEEPTAQLAHTQATRNKRKPNVNSSSPSPAAKKTQTKEGLTKAVHWKDSKEVQHYNPSHPGLPCFGQQVNMNSLVHPQNVILTNPPNPFQPMSLPTPPATTSHHFSTFSNWGRQDTPSLIPNPNPFQAHTQQRFVQERNPPSRPFRSKGRPRRQGR
jgi:hypothetical protein